MPKGLVISAFNGSSGKTAVTSILLAGLSERSIAHQPYKTGPDYIDPGFHRAYSTEEPYNLDLFMMPKDEIVRLANQSTGIAILEGMDGLFEGVKPDSDQGSTVELARMLDWPVVLVIDASRANRSSYAAVKGFIAEAKPATVAGVIFNKPRSAGHEQYLRTAYESEGIRVFGGIHIDEQLDWPERHLGLRPGIEFQLPSRQALASIAEAQLDLDGLLKLVGFPPNVGARLDAPADLMAAPRRLAIARDEAFHFYYRDSLEMLEANGFELVPFSPLSDTSLPDNIHGLILGGGFPEVYAKQLAANTSLLNDIRERHDGGLPIYAECGGLMLLSEAIQTEIESFPMCGIVPGKIIFTKQLQHFGYSHVHHALGTFRGHEFHYSRWDREAELANLWEVEKAASGKRRMEGYRAPNLHASYIHLNFREAASIFQNLFLT
ncbi:MAG: cobyrinate a,c-diamide synthase [Coraliomargarita sp.]